VNDVDLFVSMATIWRQAAGISIDHHHLE
jgi:hypothetical protein